MRKGSVTIVTGTYNKPELFKECAASVFAQTHQDWKWRVVLDGVNRTDGIKYVNLLGDVHKIDGARTEIRLCDTTDEERKSIYRPAVITNEEFLAADTEFVCWLSDDDELRPRYLEKLVACDADVAYCAVERVKWTGFRWQRYAINLANHRFGPRSRMKPDCMIDGGACLIRTEAFRKLNWLLPTGWDAAHHVDGILMNKLAEHYKFVGVNEPLLVHRAHPLSTHEKP